VNNTQTPSVQLLPFQVSPVATALDALRKHRVGILPWKMGEGKTIGALHAAKQFLPAGKVPLVLCPKATIPNWERWAKKVGQPIRAINYEKVKSKSSTLGQLKFRQWKWLEQFDLIIFDEAHYTKGQTTINSKMLIAAYRQKIPVLLLSGTLAETPLEMKALGFVTGLHDLAGFYYWLFNNGVVKNQWNHMDFIGGARAMEKLHSQIFPKFGKPIPAGEITLPPHDIDLLPVPAEVKVINKLVEDARKEDWPMVEVLRIRQGLEALKVDPMVELARDAMEERQSVILFFNYVAPAQAAAKALKCPLISGDTPAAQRTALIARFQDGTLPCLVLTVGTGGVGIDLHDLQGDRPRAVFMSPPWSVYQFKQALHRAHRVGSNSKTHSRIVLIPGTVEDRVINVLENKLSNLDSLMEGDTDPLWNAGHQK